MKVYWNYTVTQPTQTLHFWSAPVQIVPVGPPIRSDWIEDKFSNKLCPHCYSYILSGAYDVVECRFCDLIVHPQCSNLINREPYVICLSCENGVL